MRLFSVVLGRPLAIDSRLGSLLEPLFRTAVTIFVLLSLFRRCSGSAQTHIIFSTFGALWQAEFQGEFLLLATEKEEEKKVKKKKRKPHTCERILYQNNNGKSLALALPIYFFVSWYSWALGGMVPISPYMHDI